MCILECSRPTAIILPPPICQSELTIGHFSWPIGELTHGPRDPWTVAVNTTIIGYSVNQSINQSLWYCTPANFNGFRVLASLLQLATSLTGGQPNVARYLTVSWPCTLYIHFWGLFPLTKFCHAQNSFYLLPNLAFSYIGSVIARH